MKNSNDFHWRWEMSNSCCNSSRTAEVESLIGNVPSFHTPYRRHIEQGIHRGWRWRPRNHQWELAATVTIGSLSLRLPFIGYTQLRDNQCEEQYLGCWCVIAWPTALSNYLANSVVFWRLIFGSWIGCWHFRSDWVSRIKTSRFRGIEAGSYPWSLARYTSINCRRLVVPGLY